jgi:hypothetical protein
MIASGQDQAVRTGRLVQQRPQIGTGARPAITLDPPTGEDLLVHTFDAQGNRLREAPANYQRLGEAKVGEPSVLHTLTLRFHEADTLIHTKSTADFPIEPGGTCVEGNLYAANTSCTLLVRFAPQGAGHRLGFVSIAHSAAATPAMVGLTGNGYTPVVSFTPSTISTVPGTVSAGVGTISGATRLAIDGGDTLYIADTGNNLVKEIDSSGTIGTTPVGPIATPASIAVDSFGIIYTTNTAGSPYYFSAYYPWGSQTAYGYAYAAGTCTPSAPCPFSSVGMNSPAHVSIDANDNLFFEEATEGAAEMPVGGIAGGAGVFDLWYLSDQFAYASSTPSSFSVDADDNIYTSYNFSSTTCFLLEESLYNADYSPTANRVAGGAKCGYSGDGGQAAGAEISATIGQIAFDHAGNLYFADAGNQRVRRIDAVTGIIRTIAGNGTAGYKGDNGEAINAELDAPTGVAVDSQGQVYILSNSATTGTAQVVRKVGTTGLLSFGSITQGKSSATVIVNVANSGNSALNFLRETVTGTNAGDFTLDSNATNCNFSAGNLLNAGQSCQIGVIFKPGATGARSATINLVDNTVNGVNKISLSGTGVAAAVVKFSTPTAAQVIATGTKVNVAVTVTSAKDPAPTGKVNFSVDGKQVASGTIASGKTSVAISGVAAGKHTLVASYAGDKEHAAAKATETFTISK